MTTFRTLHEPTEIPTQQTDRLTLAESSDKKQAVLMGRYGEYLARVCGALLRLFGEPYPLDRDAEYIYIIEARATDNTRWVLEVLEGASGLSIRSATISPTVILIAEELRTLLETTPPADFEAVLQDNDMGTTVIYGCRDGRVYWHET